MEIYNMNKTLVFIEAEIIHTHVVDLKIARG